MTIRIIQRSRDDYFYLTFPAATGDVYVSSDRIVVTKWLLDGIRLSEMRSAALRLRHRYDQDAGSAQWAGSRGAPGGRPITERRPRYGTLNAMVRGAYPRDPSARDRRRLLRAQTGRAPGGDRSRDARSPPPAGLGSGTS